MTARGIVLLGLLAAATGGCRSSPDMASTPDLLRVAPGAVHVLLFVNPECPIANAYAPTLQALANSWRSQPVRLFLVHVDPDVDAARAAAHAAEYGLPGEVRLDPTHDLAHRLGITRTPEAAVCTAAGLAYRGRIDDQWTALGNRRNTATTHDLERAVAAALGSGTAPTPWPPAVGCLLPEPAQR
ncbi:MAG: redoxin domain-containing protein [Planctomycetes bacterium]|nr:redoxin domain-containing protein [Planctomycetota bacterium]